MKLIRDLAKYVDFNKVKELVAQQEAEQRRRDDDVSKNEPIQPPAPTPRNGK